MVARLFFYTHNEMNYKVFSSEKGQAMEEMEEMRFLDEVRVLFFSLIYDMSSYIRFGMRRGKDA